MISRVRCFLLLLLQPALYGLEASIIQGFSLVDTRTNTVLRALHNGSSIDLSKDGEQLTIVLDVQSTPIGFVRFGFQRNPYYRTERTAPYALAGDRNGRYYPEPSLVERGIYSVRATVHDINGDIMDHSSILFSVLKGSSAKPQKFDPSLKAPIIPLWLSTFVGNLYQGQAAPLTPESQPQPVAPIKTESQPRPPPTTTVQTTTNPQTDTPASGSASSDVPGYLHSPAGALTGTLRRWHKITLGFDGPPDAIESTVSDFRLDVTFRHADGTTLVVPGYYGADGNAANTGASSGPVWLVHICPPAVGNWEWESSFLRGQSSAGYFDKQRGSFLVDESDKTGRDHRGTGRLEYVDGYHHLRFAGSKKFFVKGGADSPENLLAYDDFDNTPNFGGRRKDWGPHVQDFRSGDPTWRDGKGKGIIGALNYLAREKGMNSISFLTPNIGGDDKNVFPFSSYSDRLYFDVSKLAQWEILFEHADKLGLFMHFKMQEQELDFLLDGGELGRERKLYYRELVARFGHHLALNWNIGEENGNTVSQQVEFADYIKSIDPYKSPVVIHDSVGNKDSLYGGLLGQKSYNGISLQSHPENVFSDTLDWVARSASSGQHWVVANDEQNPASVGVLPDSVDPTHDAIRKHVLWGNLMAGGGGVEYYFGYGHDNSDLTCNDFRSRDRMWTQTKHALDFFGTYVPFWTMSNRDDLVSLATAHCLANESTFLVYLPNGGTTSIDLPNEVFRATWFDPIKGKLEEGQSIRGGTSVPVGSPPYLENQDWIVLLTQQSPVISATRQTNKPNVLTRYPRTKVQGDLTSTFWDSLFRNP